MSRFAEIQNDEEQPDQHKQHLHQVLDWQLSISINSWLAAARLPEIQT
jgi:hypothetical protein